MSAFIGSPARASFLVGRSDKDLTDTPLFQGSTPVQSAMDKTSTPGAKSPAKRGGWAGSLLKRRGQNQSSVEGGTLRRLVEGGDVATSSEGVVDGNSEDQSVQERSSLDGGSMDQRSLAMSMEFFDAEEALECELISSQFQKILQKLGVPELVDRPAVCAAFSDLKVPVEATQS